MKWLPFFLCLLLLSTAEAGPTRRGKASWYRGKPGHCAVRKGLARKGDRATVLVLREHGLTGK